MFFRTALFFCRVAGSSFYLNFAATPSDIFSPAPARYRPRCQRSPLLVPARGPRRRPGPHDLCVSFGRRTFRDLRFVSARPLIASSRPAGVFQQNVHAGSVADGINTLASSVRLGGERRCCSILCEMRAKRASGRVSSPLCTRRFSLPEFPLGRAKFHLGLTYADVAAVSSLEENINVTPLCTSNTVPTASGSTACARHRPLIVSRRFYLAPGLFWLTKQRNWATYLSAK